MTTRKALAQSLTCVVMMILGAVIATAAPIARPGARDTGPVSSLAGVKRVRLMVQPVPPAIAKAGFTVEALLEQWSKKLKDAGFEMAKPSDDTPIIELLISTAADKDVPDAIAVGVKLTVMQTAHIERLEADLMLPTYTHIPVGIVPNNKVKEQTQEALDFVMEMFIRSVRLADGDLS